MTAPTKTLTEAIREVFAKHPGSLREVTIACIDDGLFDTDRYEAFIRAKMPTVQRALNSHDASGLPFAGPSGQKRTDGAQVWVARQLWDTDTYDYNIRSRRDGILGDYHTLIRLRDERIERYGETGCESIPGLSWDGFIEPTSFDQDEED